MRTFIIALSIVCYTAAALVAAAALFGPSNLPVSVAESAPGETLPAPDHGTLRSAERFPPIEATVPDRSSGLEDAAPLVEPEPAWEQGGTTLSELVDGQTTSVSRVNELDETVARLQDELVASREDDALARLAKEQVAHVARVAELNEIIEGLQRELEEVRADDAVARLAQEQEADRARLNELTEMIAQLQRGRADGNAVPAKERIGAGSTPAPQPGGGARRYRGEGPEDSAAGTGRGSGVAELEQARAVAVLGDGLFRSGQHALTPELRSAVERVLPVLDAAPEARVLVEGHTDDLPISAALRSRYSDNRELSLLRAEAVAALLEEMGVEGARLSAYGWGPHRPLVSNDTPEGRALNRRVEVRLLSSTPER